MPQEFRNDAEKSYFLENELESIKEKLYADYPEAGYASIVPVDSSDDEGAEEVGYTMYDRVGISQIISAGDADSPAVDAFGQKYKKPVHDLGNQLKYTNKEVKNAKFANAPLESDKVEASALAVEQQHDDIAMLADGTKNLRYGGMYGIVFNPNVTKMVGINLMLATSAEVIAEFAKMKKQIIKDTKQIHKPDTWAISLELEARFEGMVIAGTAKSLLSHLKETYRDMAWETHYRLADVMKNPTTLVEDAVDETTNVVMCYKKKPKVLQYKMPCPWKTLPAVFTGRGSKTETESSSAGVIVKQPLAVVIYHFDSEDES
jgi:hypothetical protein